MTLFPLAQITMTHPQSHAYAAAVVWEAFNETAELAAAVYALADQVVPHEEPTGLYCNPELAQRRMIRSEILAIAAELEGK